MRKETTVNGSKITIRVDGATEEEIQRGLAAAQKVFDDAGVTAYTAATAAFMRDQLDDSHVLAWRHKISGLREGGQEDEAAAEEAKLADYMKALNIDDMTEAQWAISDLWDEAGWAAKRACCAGWPELPDSVRLSLAVSAKEAREAREDLAAADLGP
jgi:hypothetical protein